MKHKEQETIVSMSCKSAQSDYQYAEQALKSARSDSTAQRALNSCTRRSQKESETTRSRFWKEWWARRKDQSVTKRVIELQSETMSSWSIYVSSRDSVSRALSQSERDLIDLWSQSTLSKLTRVIHSIW